MTNRLKVIRDEQGVSQVTLARISGVSLRQIQNIEAGAQPRVNTANLLARALSVPGKPISISDLFETEEVVS